MNHDQYALVTGANRGIGQAILTAFVQQGIPVIAHARHETPAFLAMIHDIQTQYQVTVKPVYFDITDTDAVKAAIRELQQTKTVIDILVNCAGTAHGGLFQMTSMSVIRDVFDVNLFAQMTLTQLLLRAMIKRQHGSIINIASIAGLDVKKGNCAYGVSKAALIAFTKTLAAESGEYGVRVNAVAPGLIDTAMASLMEDQAGQTMIADSAMKRLGLPEEVAKAVVFLSSDDASFINGQVIRVDGGSV